LVVIVEGEGQFWGEFGALHGCKLANGKLWDCLREGRRRGSSKITLGFLV